MGRLRLRASGFIHGRWDSDIGALRTARIRGHATAICDIAELSEECRRTDALCESFRDWRERWLAKPEKFSTLAVDNLAG